MFYDCQRFRKLNDPFDPYGWLSALTVRRVQFTNRILHLIRETEKRNVFYDCEGLRGLNDPFDSYGSLSVLTLRGVKFTDRILHLIRET